MALASYIPVVNATSRRMPLDLLKALVWGRGGQSPSPLGVPHAPAEYVPRGSRTTRVVLVPPPLTEWWVRLAAESGPTRRQSRGLIEGSGATTRQAIAPETIHNSPTRHGRPRRPPLLTVDRCPPLFTVDLRPPMLPTDRRPQPLVVKPRALPWGRNAVSCFFCRPAAGRRHAPRWGCEIAAHAGLLINLHVDRWKRSHRRWCGL